MHMPAQRPATSLEQNRAATTSEHDVDTGPEHNELTAGTLTAAPPRKPGVGLRVFEGSVESAAVGLPGTVRASERPQQHFTTHHELAVAFLVDEEKKPVRTQPRTTSSASESTTTLFSFAFDDDGLPSVAHQAVRIHIRTRPHPPLDVAHRQVLCQLWDLRWHHGRRVSMGRRRGRHDARRGTGNRPESLCC